MINPEAVEPPYSFPPLPYFTFHNFKGGVVVSRACSAFWRGVAGKLAPA